MQEKMQKSTKIVATIGPASDSEETIRKLYESGMNVARLNFSHGTYDYFDKVIERIRNVSQEIAIMLDTKGPEIRTRPCENDQTIEFEAGDTVFLSNEDRPCVKEHITINYDNISQMEVGNKVLIDDGLLAAEIIERKDHGFVIKMLNGGPLDSRKTVSTRGHDVDIPFVSEKDRNDFKYGIEKGLTFIAASFVRTADDVKQIREYLDEHDSPIKIISKIECDLAVENFDEILKASYGIMVARGDLGVEVDLEKVPGIQEAIIKKCNKYGKPVIVATQMLESMKHNPRPTRAEVNDVSLSILQGADAIMLSGETASGDFPVESVQMMTRIAKEYDIKVENHFEEGIESMEEVNSNAVSLFITKAAFYASKALGTQAILTPTESGYTARKVSRFKPDCMILAITRQMRVVRELQLTWGVQTVYEPKMYTSLSCYIRDLILIAVEKGMLEEEDKVVITAGHKLHRKWATNLIEVFYVKDVMEKCCDMDEDNVFTK